MNERIGMEFYENVIAGYFQCVGTAVTVEWTVSSEPVKLFTACLNVLHEYFIVWKLYIFFFVFDFLWYICISKFVIYYDTQTKHGLFGNF